MTRKRFIKMCMGRLGYDRNLAALTADAVKLDCMEGHTPGDGYAVMWWLLCEATPEEFNDYMEKVFQKMEAAR